LLLKRKLHVQQAQSLPSPFWVREARAPKDQASEALHVILLIHFTMSLGCPLCARALSSLMERLCIQWTCSKCRPSL
jgi:hypothetical protein